MLAVLLIGLIWPLLLLHPLPALCDADFLSVRTSLRKDFSGKPSGTSTKYFHESTFHYHYDGRFGSKTLPGDKRLPHLTDLGKSYLAVMSDLGIETWIVHGTLLSWWWNQKIFPWDSDLDVQVSDRTMHFLARYYNMTEYHFEAAGEEAGRTYLLEINPHFVDRSVEDTPNVIDARWIDTSSGLFIDITCVSESPDEADVLMSKDKHRYRVCTMHSVPLFFF